MNVLTGNNMNFRQQIVMFLILGTDLTVIKMDQLSRTFKASIEQWVKNQKSILDILENTEKKLSHSDRLELILAIRMAFRNIIRTIEAFDKWLQDPFIVGHMPREMLLEIQKEVWEITKKTIMLDIDHTMKFGEHMEKVIHEGKLNPLFYSKKEEKEESRLRLSV